MALKLSNNATTTLAASINTAVTSISIQAGDAAKFPTLDAGDWFPITVIDSANNQEIMWCTERVGSTLTVTRAQEGTTAKAFASGSRVDLRLTAAALLTFFDAGNLSSGTLPDARLSAALASIAGLATAADKMIYTTGANAYATTALTVFGRSILDDADAAEARTTLGLGTASTASVEDLKWLSKAVGEIYIADTSKAGVDTPPSGTGGSTVWVKMTAGETGAGQFNEGKLINESVSGSAPLVLATAEISVADSPMLGTVIDLLNTEGRIVRPSTSAGTKQNDAIQNITGDILMRRSGPSGSDANTAFSANGALVDSGTSSNQANRLDYSGATSGAQKISFDASNVARTSTETRMKNVGVTAYMRVK